MMNRDGIHQVIMTKMIASQLRSTNYSLALRLGVFKTTEERKRAFLAMDLAAAKDCEEIINLQVRRN